MAITKRIENDKIEIVNSWSIQVRTATIIEENNVELSRSFHRHVLTPYTSTFKTKEVNGDEVADLDSDGKKQWSKEGVFCFCLSSCKVSEYLRY